MQPFDRLCSRQQLSFPSSLQRNRKSQGEFSAGRWLQARQLELS
jgi:hypothetical protein